MFSLNYYKVAFCVFFMDVKTKRLERGKVLRLEAAGDVKEIFVSEDFLKPKNAKVQICFRGKSSSGIVELSRKELEDVYKDAMKKAGLSKSKVMKFEKS